MLAVPLQKPRKAWPLAAGLTALCLLLFASGAVKPPRQTSDHSAAEENAAAQKAVGNAFFSFVDTITKTQQAQDAYISSMDSKYQAFDSGGGAGLKGDVMPAGDGLDGKGTEAAAAEYMRLQGGTQSNMIDAASSFATGDLKSREEVDAMMEGESVESKTGSAMHSSTLLLNDLGKATRRHTRHAPSPSLPSQSPFYSGSFLDSIPPSRRRARPWAPPPMPTSTRRGTASSRPSASRRRMRRQPSGGSGSSKGTCLSQASCPRRTDHRSRWGAMMRTTSGQSRASELGGRRTLSCLRRRDTAAPPRRATALPWQTAPGGCESHCAVALVRCVHEIARRARPLRAGARRAGLSSLSL